MEQYNVSFAGKNNSVYKNNLINIPCFSVFSQYSNVIIDLYSFVYTINKTGWNIKKHIINSTYDSYFCYSNKYDTLLTINISTIPEFKTDNKVLYDKTINLLKEMSINAEKINNKIINITSYLKNNNSVGENINIFESAKRFFKVTKKIALATFKTDKNAMFNNYTTKKR